MPLLSLSTSPTGIVPCWRSSTPNGTSGASPTAAENRRSWLVRRPTTNSCSTCGMRTGTQQNLRVTQQRFSDCSMPHTVSRLCPGRRLRQGIFTLVLERVGPGHLWGQPCRENRCRPWICGSKCVVLRNPIGLPISNEALGPYRDQTPLWSRNKQHLLAHQGNRRCWSATDSLLRWCCMQNLGTYCKR